MDEKNPPKTGAVISIRQTLRTKAEQREFEEFEEYRELMTKASNGEEVDETRFNHLAQKFAVILEESVNEIPSPFDKE